MTISGKAGTGKSILLETIANIFIHLFGNPNACKITAPTGSAANNINGTTNHYLFGINQTNQRDSEVGESVRSSVAERLNGTMCLLIDERSMLSAEILGKMAIVAQNVIAGGVLSHLDWGGLPFIIMFGDDMQLMSSDPGASNCFDNDTTRHINIVQAEGYKQFLNFGSDTMELQTIKRQNPQERHFAQLLDKTRQDQLSPKYVALLQQYHLSRRDIYTPEDVTHIQEKALFVYATHEPKDEHNKTQLKRISSHDNPIAKLCPKSNRISSPTQPAVKRHFQDNHQTVHSQPVLLCVGTRVAIAGRNFHPKYGLYNGAIGTVLEFHFEHGANPNHGDFPTHIIVDFPKYTGPPWDKQHPTHIPVCPITVNCAKRCCQRKFIPLAVSFATTIHKCQGINVGPTTQSNSKKNDVDCIVVDIGNRAFEAIYPGTAYSAFSRGTTLGQEDPTTSAIFFIGNNLTNERLINMHTVMRTGVLNKRVQRRNQWIAYQKRHTHKSNTTEDQKNFLRKWILTTTLTNYKPEDFYNITTTEPTIP